MANDDKNEGSAGPVQTGKKPPKRPVCDAYLRGDAEPWEGTGGVIWYPCVACGWAEDAHTKETPVADTAGPVAAAEPDTAEARLERENARLRAAVGNLQREEGRATELHQSACTENERLRRSLIIAPCCSGGSFDILRTCPVCKRTPQEKAVLRETDERLSPAQVFTYAEVEKLLRSIPIRDLAAAGYGDDDACTSWSECVAEFEQADEEEKAGTAYAMACEDAARILEAFVDALRGARAGATRPATCSLGACHVAEGLGCELGQRPFDACPHHQPLALTREQHDLFERGVAAGRLAERRASAGLTKEMARNVAEYALDSFGAAPDTAVEVLATRILSAMGMTGVLPLQGAGTALATVTRPGWTKIGDHEYENAAWAEAIEYFNKLPAQRPPIAELSDELVSSLDSEAARPVRFGDTFESQYLSDKKAQFVAVEIDGDEITIANGPTNDVRVVNRATLAMSAVWRFVRPGCIVRAASDPAGTDKSDGEKEPTS